MRAWRGCADAAIAIHGARFVRLRSSPHRTRPERDIEASRGAVPTEDSKALAARHGRREVRSWCVTRQHKIAKILRLCYGLSPTAAGRVAVPVPAAEHRLAASSDPRAVIARAIRRLQDVHVTAAACEALNELLAGRAGTEKCLRLSTVQGNYRFVLDNAIDQDISFRHEE